MRSMIVWSVRWLRCVSMTVSPDKRGSMRAQLESRQEFASSWFSTRVSCPYQIIIINTTDCEMGYQICIRVDVADIRHGNTFYDRMYSRVCEHDISLCVRSQIHVIRHRLLFWQCNIMILFACHHGIVTMNKSTLSWHGHARIVLGLWEYDNM